MHPFSFFLGERESWSSQGSRRDSKTMESTRLSLQLHQQWHGPLQSDLTLLSKLGLCLAQGCWGHLLYPCSLVCVCTLQRSVASPFLPQSLQCSFPSNYPENALSQLFFKFLPSLEQTAPLLYCHLGIKKALSRYLNSSRFCVVVFLPLYVFL